MAKDMNEKLDISDLEAENQRLRAEAEANRGKLRGLDDTMKALLYMLEDLNTAKAELELSEKSLKDETDITKHLLMIAEATAHTVSIEKLMEQVVHCSREITGSAIFLSYLWDRAEKVFTPSHQSGLPHNLIPLFRTEELKEEEVVEMLLSGNPAGNASAAANFLDTRDVIRSANPVMLNVESALSPQHSALSTQLSALSTQLSALSPQPSALSPLYSTFPWLKDINISAIGIIPLKGRREALGLLIGLFSKPLEISGALRKVMDGIASQVSVALEESRLYRESTDRALELSNKIETIQAMHEIDRSILSILDRSEIIEIATRMVARVIPCDRAAIALVMKDLGGFINAGGFGLDFLPKAGLVPFGETSTTEVVETMRPQYERNLSEIRDLLPFEKILLEHGYLSHIRVPLIIKDEVIGVLNVGSKRPAAFTVENLSTLEKMASQISVALENARLVTDLEELFLGTVKSLSSAIDAKSKWTAGHSERVTSYALGIGKELGLSEQEMKELELAALLHDVGKIGTYESILDKSSKLTDEELALMRQHPVKGAEIIAPIKQLKSVIPAIKHHHEFYNGTGYPEGLKGEAIPFHARILAVADTFDAMKADRPYRTGRTMEFIVEEFKKCAGTQFDPKLIEVFLKFIENN